MILHYTVCSRCDASGAKFTGTLLMTRPCKKCTGSANTYSVEVTSEPVRSDKTPAK